MEPESTFETKPHPALAPSASAPESVFRAPHVAPEEPESELDRPKNKMLGVIVVSTLALLAGIVIGVNEVFRSVFNQEISTKQLEHTLAAYQRRAAPRPSGGDAPRSPMGAK